MSPFSGSSAFGVGGELGAAVPSQYRVADLAASPPSVGDSPRNGGGWLAVFDEVTGASTIWLQEGGGVPPTDSGSSHRLDHLVPIVVVGPGGLASKRFDVIS